MCSNEFCRNNECECDCPKCEDGECTCQCHVMQSFIVSEN